MLQSAMSEYLRKYREKYGNGIRIRDHVENAIAGTTFRQIANRSFYAGETFSILGPERKALSFYEIAWAQEFTPDKSSEKIEELTREFEYVLNAPKIGEPKLRFDF